MLQYRNTCLSVGLFNRQQGTGAEYTATPAVYPLRVFLHGSTCMQWE